VDLKPEISNPPDIAAQHRVIGFKEDGALRRGATRLALERASWPCAVLCGATNPGTTRIRLPQQGACRARGVDDTPPPQPDLAKMHNWPRTRKSTEWPALRQALMPCPFSRLQFRPAGRSRQGPYLAPSARNIKTINNQRKEKTMNQQNKPRINPERIYSVPIPTSASTAAKARKMTRLRTPHAALISQ
jgi:hypothetical protein